MGTTVLWFRCFALAGIGLLLAPNQASWKALGDSAVASKPARANAVHSSPSLTRGGSHHESQRSTSNSSNSASVLEEPRKGAKKEKKKRYQTRGSLSSPRLPKSAKRGAKGDEKIRGQKSSKDARARDEPSLLRTQPKLLAGASLRLEDGFPGVLPMEINGHTQDPGRLPAGCMPVQVTSNFDSFMAIMVTEGAGCRIRRKQEQEQAAERLALQLETQQPETQSQHTQQQGTQR